MKIKKVTLKQLRNRETKLVKRIAFNAVEVSKWCWVLSAIRGDIKNKLKGREVVYREYHHDDQV